MESTSLEGVYSGAALYLLDAYEDSWSGAPLAQVACVISGPLPLPETVHDALMKVFPALGYAAEEFFVCSTAELDARGLLLCLETVDPLIAIALDREAGLRLARAYGLSGAPSSGECVESYGRTLIVLDDFEASLADDALKRVAWHQLKVARKG